MNNNIRFGGKVKLRKRTNQNGELEAMHECFKHISKMQYSKDIDIYTDSKYTVNLLNDRDNIRLRLRKLN